jgi:hypothetical protein
MEGASDSVTHLPGPDGANDSAVSLGSTFVIPNTHGQVDVIYDFTFIFQVSQCFFFSHWTKNSFSIHPRSVHLHPEEHSRPNNVYMTLNMNLRGTFSLGPHSRTTTAMTLPKQNKRKNGVIK